MLVLIESNWTSVFFRRLFLYNSLYFFFEVGYFERMKPERKKIELVVDD